ncbi:MAG: GtrA family protein, partial [Beijerinckiaceae bacterium]
ASRFAGLDATPAWLLGFILAATATWAMNRFTTFADRRGGQVPGEWARYMAVAALGALAHFLVFRLWISAGEAFASLPALGIVPGSLASFAVTYLGASLFVFPSARKKP